jgi:hypothetical protein
LRWVKYWKIHAGWALATVLVAAAWGRHCAPPGTPEVRRRQSLDALASAKAEAPNDSAGISVPTSSVTPASPPRASDGLPAYTFEHLTTAQIRALIHSDKSQDWSRAMDAVHKLTDLTLKKELLLELLPCKDEWLRAAALMNLGELMGPEVLPLLQKALASDPSAPVRLNAAVELGKLGGTGALEALLRAAHDEDLYVQINVAAALNRLGQPGAVADLLPRLGKDLQNADDAIRRDAVGNLVRLNSAATLPLLFQALKDGNSAVRSDAHVGLARLDVPELVPAVESLLKDPALAEEAKELLDDIREWKKLK